MSTKRVRPISKVDLRGKYLLRLSSSIVNSIIPLMCYILLVATPSVTIKQYLVPVMSSVVIVMVSVWVYIIFRSSLASFMSMLASVGAVTLVTLTLDSQSITSFAVYIIVNLLLWYRTLRVMTASLLSDENKMAFNVDACCTLFFVPLFALVQPSLALSFLRIISLLIIGACVARLYLLYEIEHSESEFTSRRTKWEIIAIIMCAVSFGSVGWHLFIIIADVFFVLLLFFFSPILFLLPRRIPASLQITSHLSFLNGSSTKSVNTQQMVAHVTPNHTTQVVLEMLLLCAVAVVIIWLARRRITRSGSVKISSDAAVVNRGWVNRPDHCTFMDTKDPVRLKYQRWLQRQARKQRRMSEHETVLQYENRITGLDKGINDPTKPNRREYERYRYGFLHSSRNTREE